jgi:hypothetical protein
MTPRVTAFEAGTLAVEVVAVVAVLGWGAP